MNGFANIFCQYEDDTSGNRQGYVFLPRRSRHASRSDNLASISVEESGSAAKHTMEAWRKRVGRLAVYATARSGGAKPVALHRRAATESVLKQANLPAEWFVIF